MCEKNILLYYRNLGVNIFMWVSSRVTAVVPSAPGIHVPAVHTASSDVGIELPATWQHYQIPGQITPHFGIMVHIQVVPPFKATLILRYLNLKFFIIFLQFIFKTSMVLLIFKIHCLIATAFKKEKST